MTGGQLFNSVCDRIVHRQATIQDMAPDLSRAFRGMLADGHTHDGLKRLLNKTRLPTVSGKPRWTLGEIRQLIKGTLTTILGRVIDRDRLTFQPVVKTQNCALKISTILGRVAME
jgi:hypothetical protein